MKTSDNTKKKQLQAMQIYHIFSQLHVLMGAGITPYAALTIMQKDADHQELADLLRQLNAEIAAGRQLSEAVAQTGRFPEYVSELLFVGEQTGRVDEACEALARYYEEEDSLEESVKSAVSYPLMMIVVMFLVILVLMHQVMPVFAQIYRQLGASGGGVLDLLMGASRFLSRYMIVLAVLFGVLLCLFLYCWFTERGRKLFHTFARRFPLTRELAEELALVKFTSGLQMAQAAGLDAYKSLEMAARPLDHEPLLKKIEECKKLLYEGESFSGAMARVGIFSPFYSSMLTVFAEAGSIDRALQFIGAHYKEDTDRRIGRILSAIEPTLVIGLSLIVGVILISVIMPLISIMAGIG